MPAAFDPDAPFVSGGIFGLPFSPEEAEVVLIPVPWEATVSWGSGTRNGPAAILRASHQLDLVDRETGRPYERGISMLPVSEAMAEKSDAARRLAEPVLRAGGPETPELARKADAVNARCEEMNGWVYDQARSWLDRGKLVGLLGGDHSVSFGLIRAVCERSPGLGILQIDAHEDLRHAYAGFTWSHASIMHNVVHRLPGVHRLVQAGIRDYCPEEERLIELNPDRIRTFFDADLRARLLSGEPWKALAEEIVAALPRQVHVSFDIDGLDPSLCPHTGTPVPGGLSFPEAAALLREVTESGRHIVGFDLNEVAPDPDGKTEWDGNVGARMLYKMIGFALLNRAVPSRDSALNPSRRNEP